MYTECPNCTTVFKVGPEQLKIAGGKVRCGRCNHVFNALESLTDDVPSAVAEQASAQEMTAATATADTVEKAAEITETELPAAEPVFDALDLDLDDEGGSLVNETEFAGLDDAIEEQSASKNEDRMLPGESLDESIQEKAEEDSFFPEAVNMEDTRTFDALDQDFRMTDDHDAGSDMRGAREATESDLRETDEHHDPLGEVQRRSGAQSAESYVLEELSSGGGAIQRTFGWISTLAWSLLIMVLAVVLVSQFLFFKRADLVKIAWMKPVLEQVCVAMRYVTECDVPEPKDLKKLELVNRDVRTHPKTKGALMITATIKNNAGFIQAFPALELVFTDISENIIAKRSFQPLEYLSEEVDKEAGMQPHIPYRLMIEIVDPGKAAVNFQFVFK